MLPASDASEVIGRLRAVGSTVASAESLTGGLVCARLTAVPGASHAVQGGIVAYTHRAKRELLGVDADLLAAKGAVCLEVAQQMALGVRDRFGADWGVATTGVAGPEPSDGQPVGTVFIAVAAASTTVVELHLSGDRDGIREAACRAALGLLSAQLG